MPDSWQVHIQNHKNAGGSALQGFLRDFSVFTQTCKQWFLMCYICLYSYFQNHWLEMEKVWNSDIYLFIFMKLLFILHFLEMFNNCNVARCDQELCWTKAFCWQSLQPFSTTTSATSPQKTVILQTSFRRMSPMDFLNPDSESGNAVLNFITLFSNSNLENV